ncbi:MAG: hypothetical protein M1837_003133 [Sclerophora amabilis]|nr:MAG: hypothetical protein M1837_003133 [Sclerophora amabilis]
MPPRNPKSEYIETDTGNKVSRKSHILGTQNIILGGKTAIQSECTIRGDLHRLVPPPSTTNTSSSTGARERTSTSTSRPQKPHSTPAVSIGRYCILSPGSLLRPPSKPHRINSATASTSSNTTHLAPPSASSSTGPTGTSTATPTADVAKNNVSNLGYSYHPLHLSSHIHIGASTVCEAASIGSHVIIGARCVIGKFAIIKDHVRVLDGSVVPQGMVVPSFSVVAGRPARVVAEVGEGGVGRSGEETREEYRLVG